jgi:hypothetical protein
MKYLQPFLLLLAIVLTASSVAQQMDVSPNTYLKPRYLMTEAIWDVQLNFDVTAASGAAGNAGSEFDGNYIYSTRWASDLIHKYTTAGVLVEQFSIPGVTGLRDLAFDGTYMYGGTAGTTIFQMDFNTKTLVGYIASPVIVRHIAYDAVNDAFWVGNWASNIVLVSRAGAALATIPSTTHGLAGMYGSAWDNISAGGPFLWVFDQGAGTGQSQIIHQLHLPSGTPTGAIHDVMSDIGAGNTSALAGGLWISDDFQTGHFSIGGLLQGTPDEIFIYELKYIGPPCPVGSAANPNPADGTVNTPLTLAQLTWTNPTGAGSALRNEVFFGTNPGSMTMIHSGSLASSVNVPGQLNYNTKYYWKVIEQNDTCSGISNLWSFTTVPNPVFVICDHFEAFYWMPVGPLGLTNWGQVATNNAGGTPNGELRFSWTPSFVGDSKILSPMVLNAPAGNAVRLSFIHMVDWYSTTFTLGVGYTTDGGANVTTLWTISPTDSIPPELVYIPPFISPGNFQFVIYFSGDSYEINYWYIDDFCDYLPVELTSFVANVVKNNTMLHWTTATETNNSGFEIERNTKGVNFTSVAFVDGNGTTTAYSSYSYTDRNLEPGTYFYRLKQIDFDGTFEYSNVIEVDINIPFVFSLDQNYPNPFNPTTNIKFSVTVDSKVSLKIFDVLGREVVNLFNSNISAGYHTINFDASSLNSGVYFYQIKANGIDGTNFSSVKKMILTK